MEYKVVPFTATINQQKGTAATVSNQLEELIKQFNSEGWNYVGLESVSTFVEGQGGCFGIGATPGHMTSYQMVVFSRN